MVPSRIASWIFFALGAVAPWICGARSHLPGVLWFCGTAMGAAFLLVVAERRKERRGLQVPKAIIYVSGALGLCLAWWITRPEPPFATPFTAEHWGFLEAQFPTAILQWPRVEWLCFTGCLLLGFIAVADLGRSETFRRQLCLVIGVSGLAIACGSLAQRFLGVGFPSWLWISGVTERYNFVFFNHNAAAACLDFAWPLLVFREWKGSAILPRAGAACIALIVALLCFPLWHSESAWAIAGGLTAAGITWLVFVALKQENPRLIFVAFAGVLLAVFSWQLVMVHRMQKQYPDNWISAEMTLYSSPDRDARLRTLSMQRGDRMVISGADPFPAAWLTGLRMGAAHPFVGEGPGSWVREAVLYSNDPIVNTFYQHRQFAHHDLLQTASEWGVVPALLWVFLWIGGFYRAVRRDPSGTREVALVLALFGMALHSALHFPLQVPALQIWTILLLGLAWSRRARKTSPEMAVAGAATDGETQSSDLVESEPRRSSRREKSRRDAEPRG
ncbi:MAG: hypothetical protein QM760_07945 [Nibricoccus sp.]